MNAPFGRTLRVFGLAFCVGSAGFANATDSVQKSVQLQTAIDSAAARSQRQINQVYDETQELLREYRYMARELESLRAYDEHLGRMVKAQSQAIAALQIQLDEVQLTHRGVIPLLSRMIDTLEQFVELDVPFLPEERRRRVSELRDLLDSPEDTVAEKYRRVMEAYQIETEYGRSIEAYRGVLRDSDEQRTVDFLRIGRVALLYRSPDGAKAGVWDQQARLWRDLPDEYRSSLPVAFRVARKQAAPDLLTLPVPGPEVLQ
jgi:hypothetical protein